MPIYEYRCSHCSAINEFLVGVGKDSPKIECIECGSPQLDKIFSKSNFKINNSDRLPSQGLPCGGRAERCENPHCQQEGICSYS
ncbi:MAG TPA: zinc ribbon domain-containing protein [Spirochaetia bacterium]|nr:zinc ribbon domain-containing protein [Spirochaetia bacterium]